MSGVLDSLLEPVAEATTSRERWAAWEAKHLSGIHTLKAGETHKVPGGITVTRSKPTQSKPHPRYTIKGGGTLEVGKATADPVSVGDPTKAAMVARVRSARTEHPDSLGGATKIDHPGKPASLGKADSGAARERPATSGDIHAQITKLAPGQSTSLGTKSGVKIERANRGDGGTTFYIHHKGTRLPLPTARAAARHALMLHNRALGESSLDVMLPPLAESAKTAALSVTHAPIGKGGTNWITRSKPGNTGQLPAYIQNVRNAIMRGGVPESRAHAIAIGKVEDWAAGKGNVGPEVRAAAAKAIAELKAMEAKAHASSGAKRLREELTITEGLSMADSAERRLFELAQVVGADGISLLLAEVEPVQERDIPQAKRMELAKRGQAFPDGSYPIENQGDLNNAWQAAGRGSKDQGRVVAHIRKVARKLSLKLPAAVAEAEHQLNVKCPKCGTVQRIAGSKSCTNCGHGLSGAIKAKMAKMEEAAMNGGWAPELVRTASASSETMRHEVHDAGQHVGYVAERPSYTPREPSRHHAIALNGERIGEAHGSQSKALDTLRKHLEEAPARVGPSSNGKYLVARTPGYSGQPTYTEYPGEESARHAAGLPPKPTSVERVSKVKALAETVACDCALVEEFAPSRYAELWGPMLRGRAEGGRSVPFSLTEALAEGFGAATTSRERWIKWEQEHGFGRAASAVSHLVGRHGDGSIRLPVRPRRSDEVDPGRFRGPALSEPQMIERTQRGSWTGDAERATSDIARGLTAETQVAHRHVHADGSLGSYTPERTQLHSTIIKSLLAGHSSQAKPEFHVMAGGPASGKTHLLKSGKIRKLPKDHVTINPDLVKEMLPEYRMLKAQGFRGASSAVHEESSHIANKAINIALGQKMNIVNDVVGDSPKGKFAGKLQKVIDKGHAVHVHYAHVPTDVAARRAVEREQKTGRHVPEGYLRSSHEEVARRFHEEVRHMPVHITIHDTTGRRMKPLASKTPQGTVWVRDKRGFARFLAKGGVRAES